MGKQTEADILRDKYAQFFSSTTPTNSTSTPTLTDTIATVDGFLNGTIPYDRTKAQELIVLLLELVHVLAQLMLQMAMGKSP
jgi:hypothetical protein